MSIRLAARVVLLAGIAALLVVAMSVRGGSTGVTFATVVGLLQIDSEASYNGAPVPSATWDLKDLVPGADKFFNFGDIKPGDFGENTISLHVEQSAWLCLDFENLVSNENGENEPESLADTSVGGELAQGLEFFSWRDDGDNIFEVGETSLFGTSTQSASIVLNDTTYPIADALTGTACPGGSTCYVGIFWCAGDLAVNLSTAQLSCDPTTIGNEAQTDSMSVDVSLRAEGSDKTDFTCSGEIPPPPPPPPPTLGLGGIIGLHIKCDLLAPMGWPMPSYSIECPNGFPVSTSTPIERSGRDDRGTRGAR